MNILQNTTALIAALLILILQFGTNSFADENMASDQAAELADHGAYHDWRVMCDHEYCWAYTYLKKDKESSIIAFVRHSDKIEPSLYNLSLGKDDQISFHLRDKQFKLRVYPTTDQAYTDEESQEPDVIRAFVRQRTGIAKINNQTDSFSLLGFEPALKRARLEFVRLNR